MSEANVRYDIGKAHLRTKEFAKAVDAFQSLTEADPEDAEAWQFLGAAQSQNKSWPAAISAFRRAEALDPSARNQYNLAVALSEGLSRHDEARLYVERALEKDPEHAPSKQLHAQLVARTAAPDYDPRQAQTQIQQIERQRGPVPLGRKFLGIFVAVVISVIACVIWVNLPIGGPLVGFGAGWLVGILTAKACGRGGQTAARIAGWTAGVFFVPLCCLFAYGAYYDGRIWSLVLSILAMFVAISQAYKIAFNTE
jgi:tetratricopeptide (TPR) repeat protein